MRYILNTAVIPAPGLYRYELIEPAEARVWLAAGPWASRVGYGNTRAYIERKLGVRCELSRAASYLEVGDEALLEVGDEALVVRLSYRMQDPARKRGELATSEEDWELGLLTRVG